MFMILFLWRPVADAGSRLTLGRLSKCSRVSQNRAALHTGAFHFFRPVYVAKVDTIGCLRSRLNSRTSRARNMPYAANCLHGGVIYSQTA